MLDYKSMSNEELRDILAGAGAELMSRGTVNGGRSSNQHLYQITMRRTPKAEPRAFRFTLIEDAVIPLPLPLDQVIGKTGKVIGGEFWLNDGDVVQKIAASGMISYLIAWQGTLDDQNYDVWRVLEGETEAETIAKIEAFVRGDRRLLIEQLTESIAYLRKDLPEYDEKARVDEYWRRVVADDRKSIQRMEAMLNWAKFTHNPDFVHNTPPIAEETLINA